ncbi:MAG: hypothetical protein K2L57_02650, partial [Muribaculaceae bacterium]|nr:hypothetical protein [Muribaculaceae bacterium]
MKFRKLTYLLLCAVVAIMTIGCAEAMAATKKSKARTSQTSKRSQKKSTGSKSRTSGTKKRTAKKSKLSKNTKKGKGKRRKGRNVAKSTYKAPPKEQPMNDSLTLLVNHRLIEGIPVHLNPGGLRVNSVRPDKARKTAAIGLNENFTYMPVTRKLIDSLSNAVRSCLPDSISDYRVTLNVGDKSLAYYITKVDRLPEKYRTNPAFVEEVHPLVTAKKGMDRDIIALWHSHGRYYNNGNWQWQRPMLFETAEDIYTMSYIL